MGQPKKFIFIAIIAVLTSFICSPIFGQSAESDSFDLLTYTRLAVDVSTQIDGAERAVATAEEKLDELELSGATDLDIDDAEASVEASKLSLAETKNQVAYKAFDLYMNYVRAKRSYDFAVRQRIIAAKNVTVSKQRYDEGVMTEAAYLNDVTSNLNAEISLLQNRNALESARRNFLRYISVGLDNNAEITEVRLPYIELELDTESFETAIESASSSFYRAQHTAEIAKRRYAALSRLSSSVTQKELEAAQLAAETADLSYATAKANIEDQVWNLVSSLEVLAKTVEAGEQLLGMAETSWANHEEQYEYGLISDLQRDSYELSFDKSKDSAVQKVENHFMHVMKIEQARGSDLVSVLAARLD